MMDSPQFLELSGDEITPWMDALGALRIRIFREYPYLYDGTLDYERAYLKIYQQCPRSRTVLAQGHGGSLVGATTCLPLSDECEEFRQPFIQAGLPVDEYLYFGESMVLSAWRGRGLGKEFFARRETHARRLGLGFMTFCAVDRPTDHPRRPVHYRTLDGYWKSLGFTKQPQLQANFSWKEIDEPNDSLKSLTFWIKPCQPEI